VSALLPALVRRSATQARIVLLGCLCLLTAFQIVIVGQASALEEAHGFSRMAELVPAFLQRGLGSKSLLLVTFKGTIALGYFHPVVAILISVLAIYFATEPAHEVESGLVDVTLARSVPRHIFITRSLLLAIGAVTAATLLMAAGTQLGLRLFASPEFDAPSAAARARLLLHLAAVASCFAGIGLAIATGLSRHRLAGAASDLLDLAVSLLSRAIGSDRGGPPLAESCSAAVGCGRLQRARILAIQPAGSLVLGV
jgi:hypothetical protein